MNYKGGEAFGVDAVAKQITHYAEKADKQAAMMGRLVIGTMFMTFVFGIVAVLQLYVAMKCSP